jgi:hypothetical protein
MIRSCEDGLGDCKSQQVVAVAGAQSHKFAFSALKWQQRTTTFLSLR